MNSQYIKVLVKWSKIIRQKITQEFYNGYSQNLTNKKYCLLSIRPRQLILKNKIKAWKKAFKKTIALIMMLQYLNWLNSMIIYNNIVHKMKIRIKILKIKILF